jgi:hypothetical protein
MAIFAHGLQASLHTPDHLTKGSLYKSKFKLQTHEIQTPDLQITIEPLRYTPRQLLIRLLNS